MIHLIDPRYSPPPLDLTVPLGGPRKGRVQWLGARYMHGAFLVAVRQRTGRWRVLKSLQPPPKNPITRQRLNRMVTETMEKVA